MAQMIQISMVKHLLVDKIDPRLSEMTQMIQISMVKHLLVDKIDTFFQRISVASWSTNLTISYLALISV